MAVSALPVDVAPSRLFRQCGAALGDRVLRLQDEPLAILKALYRLGSLVVTTFSGGSRVSQNMHYPPLTEAEPNIECVGQRCHLRQRLLVEHWHSVLAVLEPTGDMPARSLLFFDRAGQPLQQVAVAQGGAGLAFEELVCAMLHPQQQTLGLTVVSEAHSPRCHMPPPNALERAWAGACDEDDFVSLLQRSAMPRSALYRSVRDSFACPLRLETLPAVLAEAAKADHATTLCVGNSGVRLCMTAPWSSPRWQQQYCHLAHNGALVSLDMSRMQSLWRLRKPGEGEVVTALEALDHQGRWLWTLSAGHEGEAAWRALLRQSCLQDPCR